MKKRTQLIALSVLILAIACFAFFLTTSRPETVSPKRGKIVDAVYALGRVKSWRHYDLRIGILTTVKKLYVREGQAVKKGDPLIQFADSALFRAPFDGVVTSLNVNEGESAAPQISVLQVEDLKDKYIEVSLEQSGALRVEKGQTAKIVFESLRGETLQGKVTALFSKRDEFLAQIEVQGLKESILPGMTADAAILVGENPNALLIPLNSYKNGYVTVLRDRRRVKVPVKIGAIDGQWAEVLGDSLKENDQLIVSKK